MNNTSSQIPESIPGHQGEKLIVLQSKQLEVNGAVVVAQLVERFPLTPEIHGSNPNIGKILSTNCTYKKKRKINIKRPGMGHL